jgi:hypothetical protein
VPNARKWPVISIEMEAGYQRSRSPEHLRSDLHITATAAAGPGQDGTVNKVAGKLNLN